MIQLPPRIDLFAFLILLGIGQGGFLSYFFLKNGQKKHRANFYLGLAILSMAIIMTDVWLGYTNYMLRVLWLVDSTEPFNLAIFPALYLYFRLGLRPSDSVRIWPHFIPVWGYFLYLVICQYPQPLSFKYDQFMDAFHPEIPRPYPDYYGPDWLFWLKRHINDLTAISMVAYLFGSGREVWLAYRANALRIFSKGNRTLVWYRNLFVHLTLVVSMYLVIRLSFDHDLGDHIIVAHMAFVIYVMSFAVIRQSGFFHTEVAEPEVRKYEKSSLTPELETRILQRLEEISTHEKPYLDSDCSLPGLAQRLQISTHHLSQILNDRLGLSFFEWLAKHRIQEAKQLLVDSRYTHLKIEEIAERVGYNSKSAFNGAFKRETGQTPSVYRSSSLSAGTSS